ncbi:uncharacterized protein LOC119571392 [Penaeus monodon]|uniref:uncharacterized protein LOC119571392 n=1 Tax=Penaeus monodon TaxID=6687 RepID=UPI0018A6DDD5|nr:uncharacterized protein LOC119571392 [Penaeus monodon]
MSLNLVELVKCAKEAELEVQERERQREYEANEAEKQRAHELALARVRPENLSLNDSRDHYPKLRMPLFTDGNDDIDDYLRRFEKLAALQGWNSNDYHIYLGSLLALQIYVSLADDILKDYSQLKDALLKAYNVDADSYRKKFKESKVGDTETYVQLITRMTQYLDHWLIMSSVEREYNSLFDFLIQDQLLSNCPLDLRIFLKERTFASTVEMAQTADGYRCAHRAGRGHKTPVKDESAYKKDTNVPLKDVICHHCSKVGHIRPSCPELKFAKPKTSQKVNAAFKANVNYDHGITCDGSLNGKPVNVLFDSGCSSVIVKESLVPASVKRGKVVALYDYLGERREFPTARCLIRSKFLNGWFDVVVAPIKFTDVLIGMVPGVKASSVNIPNTKAAKTPQRSEVNAVATRAAKAKENVGPDKLIVPSFKFENVSKQDFMDAQSSCPSLEHIRSKERIKAIVTVKSRHFSHRKTAEKVFHKFFWPGAGAEIKRYCRSCHACQKTVPKGKIRKAPMVQMPVISEPFSRVAIDIVGPISPPSSRGHKYMLTLIDMATRFPEAVPLRNIDSVTVAEALLTIFARVGIPKEILSDRGTQFKSDLMAEINRLLSVKALYTSPYHACCNGTVERFHAVLKAMLKKLCSERPHDWDRYIPSVLFAYREIPHDTLKFSPFELLYGRKVRGPLSILHNLWTKDIDGEVKSTYQYVLDLRSRLEQSAQLASAHADVNSRMYKTYFDRKARARTLKEGDEVLVLLPTSHNKLTVQWKGPYSVVRKHENGVDYGIKIKGKIRLYHVNMLKKYERRENGISHSQVCQACVVDASDPIDKNANGVCDIPELYNPGKYEFNFNSELSNEQTSELNHLIADFLDVFVDKPGMTSTVVHDIHLTTEVPVHTKPYPIPYHLRNAFDEEVERMRELRVIEPSTSAYCSPVVLVKKADNSWRFCVDFRSPNDISLFDAEPMPTMEEALGSFVGDSYFTEIDLCKGYWQIPLSDKAKQYTAFATQKYGLMQFRKLPFGLRTACATFIRLMRKVTAGLNNVNCYFDNLVIHSQTFSDHLLHLRKVLERLREHGLTAGPSKCYFAYPSIKYLGFNLSDKGLSTLPDKVSAIKNMPLPETKKQLRSFLGTLSFYRKFIPNLANLAYPLNALLKKFSPNKLNLTPSLVDRINELKDLLMNAPILTLPDYSKTFYLRTDASDTGLGAVLLQSVDGVLMPIAYASRKLKDRETRYAVIEREGK